MRGHNLLQQTVDLFIFTRGRGGRGRVAFCVSSSKLPHLQLGHSLCSNGQLKGRVTVKLYVP